MAWLYLAPAMDPEVAVGARVAVVGDEARHAVQVARLRAGERISVADGRGTAVAGPVISATPAEVIVEVEERRFSPEPVPALRLAQALAKGDRDELAVQAATELGIAGVVPWQAERSVSRWEGPKVAKGEARWRAIVAEASKLSLRARLPEVGPLASTRELAALGPELVVLEPEAEARLTEVPLPEGRITLVVGPEGGVSPAELEVFRAAGATLARLGPELLRTSTAGPAAISVLNARLGRW